MSAAERAPERAPQLWARLGVNGLVEGELPEQAEPVSPWYVRVMLGIAGWIGALFLLGFVGAAFAFIMRDASAALVLGAACCGGAYAMFRSFEGNSFAEQFALALSLAGQGLVIVGLADMFDAKNPPFYFAVAAFEAALVLAVPNFLHRVLAAAGAAIAVALAIHQSALHGLAAPLLCLGLASVWLAPRRWALSGRIWRPIGYGLVLALLLAETFRLFGGESLFGSGRDAVTWMSLQGPLPGRALTAAVLVGTAAILCLREGFVSTSRTFLLAVTGALAIGLLSLNAPGLASALLILLLGFAAGNRLLMALGIFSLLGFISHFYYSLHATLLTKSAMLGATGLCLLATHYFLRRAAPGSDLPANA